MLVLPRIKFFGLKNLITAPMGVDFRIFQNRLLSTICRKKKSTKQTTIQEKIEYLSCMESIIKNGKKLLAKSRANLINSVLNLKYSFQ